MPSLLLAALACAGTHGPVLYARDEDGFGPVAGLPAALSVPVPFLSRSERVQRIARTDKGLGIRIYSGSKGIRGLEAVELRAISHPADAQVLIDAESRAPILVEAPTLPRSVTSGGDDELLPWLARQDLNGLPGRLTVFAPEDRDGKELIVIGREAAAILPSSLPGGPRECLRRAPKKDVPSVEISSGSASAVDQLFFAKVRAVDTATLATLKLATARVGPAIVRGAIPRRGEGPAWSVVEAGDATKTLDGSRLDLAPEEVLELWFEAPPHAEAGRTWTILVDVRMAQDARAQDVREPEHAPPRSGMFRDVAREVGIDMVHMEGPDEQLDIRPTMGPGAAWGDIDGDGWVDLFLPQGGGRAGSRVPRSRMYHNRGDGTFEDVSKAAGLALQGAGMGALFLDADGDGDLDLFVANYGRNRYLVNDGHGRFTDASDAVGLAGDPWHASVVAADADGDGDLDLYVTSYLHYDEALMPPAEELGRYQREDPLAMLPMAFPGERSTFLRNDLGLATIVEAASGGVTATTKPTLRFADVTDELGVSNKDGRGMQALFFDFDRDGKPDLYVANDQSPNRMWRNEGGGKFKDISLATGLDDPRGSMGLAAGDVDGDGDEDLLVTNWQLESNALYLNNLISRSPKHRIATFRDAAVNAGLAQLSVGVTKWGCELADFDDDGDLDLFYANGYTSPDYESTGICVGQPCHYFENDGEGRFAPAFEKAGPDVALPLASRAAVACDYDQDGDLDLVVTANNGRVRLLRNESPRGRSWIGVRLVGSGANTRAIGAEVELRVGGKVLRRTLRAGTSYLGGNAPELHFGLADAKKIDACIVRWPDGHESTPAIDGVNRFVTLTEPRW